MSQRFEQHARTVTVLTFFSRVTGLARDAALSRVFGVNALTDAFWFAFLIPNLFRRLFGEGALSAAFLPAYTHLDRDDPATARHLATLRPEAPSEGEAEAWTRTLDELMAMNVELGLMERILRSAVRGGAGRVPKRRTIGAAVGD